MATSCGSGGVLVAPNVGDTLPNGARVLAVKASRRDEFVVLAFTGEDDYQPFVTWVGWAMDSGRFATVSGHYFCDVAEASADFKERA